MPKEKSARKSVTVLKRGISFDLESFRVVEAVARRKNTSFSGAIRLLIQAGAEKVKAA